ncbi:serine carboxypeptidase S28-domain-containing protein [Mycena floridula]|nr:serine carboxypeptidase S28-domain-containing protein [Mycena floridula]
MRLFVIALGVSVASALVPKPPGIPLVEVPGHLHENARLLALPPYDMTYYFDQLIDHDDPSKGTFKQRYWHTAEFYQQGGPIIFMNAGEVNAAPYYGYILNVTINGVVAQKYGGAAIVLEHRFFGLSNPYPNLNTESLELLTIHQSIEDDVYFAKNVVLPQANGDQLGPDKVPWILFGGSYPGALVSWTMVAHPDVFWIGYASSAVVQADIDFWRYYEPMRLNMPQNCSADVEAVVAYVDEVMTGSDVEAQIALRTSFGFGGSTNVDFAGALRWDLWLWQDLQPNTGPGGAFYRFCDDLEVNSNGVSASADGFGLNHTLTAWANRFKATAAAKREFEPTKDLEARADIPVDDPNRSWTWIVCNELGSSLVGPPLGEIAVVSRLVTWQDNMRGCVTTFPEAFSTFPIPDVAAFNTKYQGWNVTLDRLFFANGKRDPWKEMTVSAVLSPAVSTDRQPIGLSNGFHASDLVMQLAAPDPTIVAVQDSFIQYVETWLTEWPSASN